MPSSSSTTLRSGLALAVLVLLLLLTPAASRASPPSTVGWPVRSGEGAYSAAFSPDGRVLVTHNSQADSLSAFAVTAGGALTRLGDDAGVPDGSGSLRFSPDSGFVATASSTTGAVSVLAVDDSGPLTPVGTATLAGKEPEVVGFSPDGHRLAMLNQADSTLVMFSVSSSGALTSSGAAVAVGPDATDAAFLPDGRHIIVLRNNRDWSAPELTVVDVADDGTLTATTIVVPTVRGLATLAVSPQGDRLAVTGTNQSGARNTIGLYAVAADGTPVPDGAPAQLGRDVYNVAFDASERFLTTTGDDDIVTYRRLDNGRLAPVSDPVTPQMLHNPEGVAFSSRDHLLVVMTDLYYAEMYSIDGNGVLTPVGQPVEAPGPQGLAASGNTIASANANGTLSSFIIGWLSFDDGWPAERDPPVAVGAGARAVAFSPRNRLLATANEQGNPVTPLRDTTGFGDFVRAAPDLPAGGPRGLTFSPDGRQLAVAETAGNGVRLWDITTDGTIATTGHWLNIGNEIPLAVAYSPDGHLLVVGTTSFTWLFAVAADGTATPIDSISDPYGASSLVFSADGSRLVSANPGGVAGLYDVVGDSALTRVGQWTAPGQLSSVSMRPDGTLVAATDLQNDTMTLLRVTPAGTLSPIGSPAPTGRRPSAVLFYRDFVAVASSLGDSVALYALGSSTLDTVITRAPADVTADRRATFTFDANAPATYTCSVDGGPSVPCDDGTFTTGDEPDGQHTLAVLATDLLGHSATTSTTTTWTVDTTPPSAPALLIPVPGARDLVAQPAFAWAPSTDVAAGVNHYELLIDGVVAAKVMAAACAATCTATPDALTDGAHAWSVKAVDAVGNAVTTATRTFTVDAAPPAPFALAQPADATIVATRRPSLSWTAATDAGAGVADYDVVIDDQVVASTTSTTYATTADLADGVHHWHVVARDVNGNARAGDDRTFIVDTTPPQASLRASPTRFVPPYDVELNASASTDPGGRLDRYEFDLDGDGTYETRTTSPHVQTRITTEGAHAFGVRVIDQAGLSSTATAQVQADPVVTGATKAAYVSIDGGAPYTRTLDVALDLNPPPRSGATLMVISNDGKPDEATRQPVTARLAHWQLERGDRARDRRTVYVVFYNSAGYPVTNGRVSDDILYDPYAPTITLARLRRIRSGGVELAVAARDRGAGVASLDVRSGRRTIVRHRAFKTSVRLRLGRARSFVIVVRDKAGNTRSRTVRLR